MVSRKVKKLQGKVLKIEKTNEKFKDEYGNEWKKCIFTIGLTGFSKRTPEEKMPKSLLGKEVKLVRWCCFDWHYKIGIKKTLDSDETEAVIKGAPIETVYW